MPIVLLLLLGGGGWWWWHRQATASAPQLPAAPCPPGRPGLGYFLGNDGQCHPGAYSVTPLNIPVDPVAHAQPLPNGQSDGGLAAQAAAQAAANPSGADPSMSDSAFWNDVWSSLNMGGPGTLAPPGAIASLPQSTQGNHVGAVQTANRVFYPKPSPPWAAYAQVPESAVPSWARVQLAQQLLYGTQSTGDVNNGWGLIRWGALDATGRGIYMEWYHVTNMHSQHYRPQLPAARAPSTSLAQSVHSALPMQLASGHHVGHGHGHGHGHGRHGA
jgi:hypothetical protein